MADVVVIGAGVGGLAAATRLAARGLSVDVLEAGPRVGGKLNVRVVDGVEVDTGPSVLTLPDALDAVFRVVGSSVREEISLREPDPAFRYLYPDGVALDVFVRPDETVESVRATLGAQAADDFAAFLRYAARIWNAAAPHFVYGPAPTPATLARGGLASLALLPRIDPLRGMWGAIRARVRSPHLRWLLARYATYNGSDPRRAPATLNCIAHVELAMGGYGVQGGMYEVARALARAAERAGARIHTGRAGRAHPHPRRARAVGGDGGWPVLARGRRRRQRGRRTRAGRPPPARHPPRRRAEPSMSGWVGIVRARRRTGAAARVAHTVLFPGTYMDEFADIFDRGVPPRRAHVYLCAQEACHGRTGWDDEEPLFAMANAPAEPADAPRAPAAWTRLRETVMRRVRGAGLVAEHDALAWERTPTGLAAEFPGSRGSIYGAASNSPLAAFRRPPNRVAGVRGLYLASGSAHPGGGVPLCVLSGEAAARALLADRGMQP
jgi:phytoene dehydrogenase-like protein